MKGNNFIENSRQIETTAIRFTGARLPKLPPVDSVRTVPSVLLIAQCVRWAYCRCGPHHLSPPATFQPRLTSLLLTPSLLATLLLSRAVALPRTAFRNGEAHWWRCRHHRAPSKCRKYPCMSGTTGLQPLHPAKCVYPRCVIPQRCLTHDMAPYRIVLLLSQCVYPAPSVSSAQ